MHLNNKTNGRQYISSQTNNDLTFSQSLDSNYLLSLFHSKNIETNLKISAIVSQYESNIDFFSVYSKAKVFKMNKAFDRFNKTLQAFINELTLSEPAINHINHYLIVLSRIIMFKSLISQLSSLSESLINSSKDYINSLYAKEHNEEIKVVLSQYNMHLNQLKDVSKKPISRMSTKSNTDKLIEDEIKGIPTPKFVAFELDNDDDDDDQNSFSFDGRSNIEQNMIVPPHLQKEERKFIKKLNLYNQSNSKSKSNNHNTDFKKSESVGSKLYKRRDNSGHKDKDKDKEKEYKGINNKPMPCVETLKAINEMFQSKIITKDDRSLLKEKLIEKDDALLAVLKMSLSKENLITNIKEYLSN